MQPKKLVQILRSQVIPWAVSDRGIATVLARAEMRPGDLPEGVTLSRRQIAGQRVVIKNQRRYGNHRNFTAEWPKDNLQEHALPKIACIISGTADYLLGNCCIHCGPGTFILIPPHIPHQRNGPFLTDERLQSSSCVLLHALAYQHGVHFWYSRSINEQHINEAADNYLISSATTAQLLQLMMDEAAEKKAHFDSVASGLLAAFFATIAREIESDNYMYPGPKENIYKPARPTASFADQIQEYLESKCNKQLTVEDVATHMYMSTAQFYRRMRQETGMTFVEMLTRIRIERAQKMLRETDLTAVTIALSLSFRSSTYFQSLFRSRVGCTPMEYRRQTQSNPSQKN